MAVIVTSLHVYPIKSCGGISLSEAAVDLRGLRNDRLCLVVDPDGVFMTQRDHPRMALIRPVVSGSVLTLSGQGQDELVVNLADSGPSRSVTIWDDTCLAVDQGDAAGNWLSEFLGTPCRLVKMLGSHIRPVDPDYTAGGSHQVGFADGFPFLLISEASLDDLNSRLTQPIPMNRFRPNIVVSGCEAFAEDTWQDIRIGGLAFSVVKPCARCVVTTTNQSSAERGTEPLRTLATYRYVADRGVIFGQNVIRHGTGTIRVGDAVQILRSGAPDYSIGPARNKNTPEPGLAPDSGANRAID